MDEETKELQATPEMAKFFENLLDLKKFVKQASEQSKDPLIKNIYDRLDVIIKEKTDV